MYTNSLLGTAYDERHVWRPAAQERLEQAKHDGVYADVPCECGEVSAVFEPGDDQQHSLLLLHVREYEVGSLAEFLAHPDTCGRCVAKTENLLGIGAQVDEVREGFPANDSGLEEPERAHTRHHQQRAGEMYDERYSGLSEDLVPAKHLEQSTLALGEQHRVRRQDTGEVVEATVVDSDQPEVLDDGETLYQVVAYSGEGQDALQEAAQQAQDAALSRLSINSYGKPMHLFVRGRGETAACGQALDGIEIPNNIDPEQQDTFRASEDFDTLEDVLDVFETPGDAMYCQECAAEVRQQAETVLDMGKDALREWQAPEDERTSDVADSPQYAAFVEYGREGQHGPARVVDTEISVASDLREAGRQHLAGQQVGRVQHEVEVEVEVDPEDAERLSGWLADRAAEDSR